MGKNAAEKWKANVFNFALNSVFHGKPVQCKEKRGDVTTSGFVKDKSWSVID